MPGNAVKLGLYILSHAEGFSLSQAAIARNLHMDEKTVRVAMRELEKRRFLVRHDIRNARGYRVGTAYAVTDVPFTDEELETLAGPPGKIPGGKIPGGESPGHKKTISRRETTTSKKSNPPGGSLRDCAPPPTPTEEDPMPRTAAQSEALPLDLPEQPKAQGRKDEPSAQTVVAAFVDSYRKHHSGGNPTRAVIGRVSRSAKAILATGAAGPAELTAAATELGTGPYANLDTALAMHRQKGTRHMGTIAPCPPRGTFAEASNEADRQFCDQLKADPELAAWIVTDKVEASRLIALDPELSEVFAKVGAA